jgi:hypothetical protein
MKRSDGVNHGIPRHGKEEELSPEQETWLKEDYD